MIRKATNSEVRNILDYSPVVIQEATMGHVQPDKALAEQIMTPFLDNGGYYLISTDNHVIHGWIAIGWQIDFYTDEPVGIILELYVLPAYRKKRIAEELCKEALHHFKQTGVNRVQLNVFAGNKAKRLYEKLGFRDISTSMEKEI